MTKKRGTGLIKEKDGGRGLVPARESGYRDKVYNAYLSELNPRENPDVQSSLAACTDPRFKEFLERVMEARYQRVSLATIAKACGIDLAEFQNWYNKEAAQRAIARAQTASVLITADMAQDAMSKDVPCERCDDLGFVAAPAGLPEETPGYRQIDSNPQDPKWIRTCPNCQGKRRVRKPGDAHSRDRILEMSGLTKKNAGINIIQNFGGAAHSSAVDGLNDAMPLDTTFEVISD